MTLIGSLFHFLPQYGISDVLRLNGPLVEVDDLDAEGTQRVTVLGSGAALMVVLHIDNLHQNMLWLQIPMNDATLMAVGKSREQVPRNPRQISLLDAPVSHHGVEKLTTSDQLLN